MEYIKNYDLPISQFKILDKLYLIPDELEDNKIIEVIITGIEYKLLAAGNKLVYKIVEYPTPVYVRNDMRFTESIDSDKIDTNEVIAFAHRSPTHYYIGSSLNVIKRVKADTIQCALNMLTSSLNSLNK